jgi:hypothetical protein
MPLSRSRLGLAAGLSVLPVALAGALSQQAGLPTGVAGQDKGAAPAGHSLRTRHAIGPRRNHQDRESRAVHRRLVGCTESRPLPSRRDPTNNNTVIIMRCLISQL